MIDKISAKSRIVKIFKSYKALTIEDRTAIAKLKSGKIYEVFVLAELIQKLSYFGYAISFAGTTLKFKAKGGPVKQSDPHFNIRLNGGPSYQVFVDVYFQTMGSPSSQTSDRSAYHELDIGILESGINGTNAPHDKVALAIECKELASVKKSVVREVLGLRRELSLLSSDKVSPIFQTLVPAFPPSELWLACSDPRCLKYQASPRFYGIEIKHLVP